MSETTKIEWGLRFDETDCDTPHPGDWERVFSFGDTPPQPYSDGKHYVHNHAAVLVKRSVTYSDWEPG